MAQELSAEAARPIYKYTLTDLYGKEYEVKGYSERVIGETLIIETLFDGEQQCPNTKKWRKELLPSDGPMPFFYNGEKLGGSDPSA